MRGTRRCCGGGLVLGGWGGREGLGMRLGMGGGWGEEACRAEVLGLMALGMFVGALGW